MEKQTFYFVYRTTNLINGKYYIGKHKTQNLSDGYIGSGKLLKRAIQKYGRENFQFEILEWFDDEVSMNLRESQLVTEEFCKLQDNYNLCVGGQGGGSYINRMGLNYKGGYSPTRQHNFKKMQEKSRDFWRSEQGARRKSELMRERRHCNTKVQQPFKGKTHTEETRVRMSLRKRGSGVGQNNSQYGTIWITNGIENRKIIAVDPIPVGWYKGRMLTPRVRIK